MVVIAIRPDLLATAADFERQRCFGTPESISERAPDRGRARQCACRSIARVRRRKRRLAEDAIEVSDAVYARLAAIAGLNRARFYGLARPLTTLRTNRAPAPSSLAAGWYTSGRLDLSDTFFRSSHVEVSVRARMRRHRDSGRRPGRVAQRQSRVGRLPLGPHQQSGESADRKQSDHVLPGGRRWALRTSPIQRNLRLESGRVACSI